MVVRSCKNGDINTSSIIQPMKLTLGSYKIMGIPKFAKSAFGFNNMVLMGIQMINIHINVIEEVYREYFRMIPIFLFNFF